MGCDWLIGRRNRLPHLSLSLGCGGFGRRNRLLHRFGRRNRLPHRFDRLLPIREAGGLIDLQLVEAAVDGALDAGFVAGEFGGRVGTGGVDAESAGQEVARIGRDRRRRRRSAFFFGELRGHGVLFLAGLVLVGDPLKEIAVDAGFQGKGAVEAPPQAGDAHDQVLFDGADGLEAVEMVVEAEEELFGILIEHDVFVGAQAVDEAIAAGCGLSRGGTRPGRFLGVFAVGIDLRLARLAGFVWVLHIGLRRARAARSFRFHTMGAGWGMRGAVWATG